MREKLISPQDPRCRPMALPPAADDAHSLTASARSDEAALRPRSAQSTPRSDDVEGELVENGLLGGLGVLADQVNLAVRTAAMVKTHDVTVRG